ncbi:cell division ATP-binding protein FtsE [Clostridium tarantellae]|uniref:Cell division ATP-binding protein FtsE n=1 Tax=Clostridium tarantellae TaxID=39493 RepID=A0A6I1MPA2_9CLOT|nr:cell division ATP-binding protein FtsE [Clostridium tarantellae]MPQ42701.1 cell division ATP-binding protein FtsE [Clostridium tarantellae]
MIKLEKVNKIYDNNVHALKNIDLLIKKGEFVFLVGASGSGKSSLIKLMLREIKATNGKIIVDNVILENIKEKEVPYFRRKLGVVFQDFRLLQNKTIYDNIAYAMKVVEANKQDIEKKVPVILARVGLSEKANSYPHELSGGEQQRASIARAIINNPKVLLADEPTGNLDPKTTEEILDLLIDINKKGTTVIMATHDSVIVDKMKKRVIYMKNGEIVSDNMKGGYVFENSHY